MSLEHILLGMLREPASGYDLKASFAENIRPFWSAELSQIYPALKSLERAGCLRSSVRPSDKGPPRRVYRRTAAGRRELLRWLRTGPQLGAERFAYIAQLVFMHELDDLDETLRFLDALREKLGGYLALLREFEAEVAEQDADCPDNLPNIVFHEYIGLRMGIHSLTAKLRWCDEVIAWVQTRRARESTHAKL